MHRGHRGCVFGNADGGRRAASRAGDDRRVVVQVVDGDRERLAGGGGAIGRLHGDTAGEIGAKSLSASDGCSGAYNAGRRVDSRSFRHRYW